MASSRKVLPVAPGGGPPEKLDWSRQRRLLWGCVLLELMGESTLNLLPLLLTGSRACQTSYQAIGHKAAIEHLRQLIGPMPTRRAVQKAVRELQAQARKQGFTPSFYIDEASLAFRREPGQDAVIAQAQIQLSLPVTRRQTRRALAPIDKDLTVRLREDAIPVPISVRLASAATVPAPQHHVLKRAGVPPLTITLADLRATARRLDLADRASQRSAVEHWERRLDDILVEAWVGGQLQEADKFNLTGLRHLIGLPGSGKTTLIMLICAHLAAQQKRVAVFFTSIETARDYLERLRQYEVSAALLVGRSPATHARHADRLAQLIAMQGNGGFAETRPGTELLAQTCPLPAFAVDEALAWREWQPTEAPCENFYLPETLHKDRPQALLCPLWSACGRVRNQRELVTASVWLGHVRGSDTAVPAHVSEEKLQYFELLAETFDLLIFDEADDTQSTLDALGALTLELGGTSESIHIQAQRVTDRALMGTSLARDRELLLPHHYAANTFERHLIRLYEEVQALDDNLGRQLENQLLTTNYLVRYALRQAQVEVPSERRAGIYTFWESAMYAAFFRDASSSTSYRPLSAQWQQQLGFASPEAAEMQWNALVTGFSDYLYALYHDDDVQAAVQALVRQLADLVDPDKADLLGPATRVLIVVGFGVAAYQKLARISQPLVQYNLLPDWIVGTKTSEALRQTVPLNLLGAFSSVRFRYKENRQQGIAIDYLLLDVTPRLLLHRLHERGAHVLLASATSWLPHSSAYHIGVTPSYVLRSRRPEPIQVRLRCWPLPHPHRPGEFLRFSGANAFRDDNLTLMVENLARADGGRDSELERAALRSPSGRHGRLCALIVNSYEQVHSVVRAIQQANESLAARTRGVVRIRPEYAGPAERYLLKGQVETLGQLVVDEDVRVIVLPFTALGRGINIVFNNPDDAGDIDNRTAAIGTVYFLTRPHPMAGDLTLMLSTIARRTEEFDQHQFADLPLAAIEQQYEEHRHRLFRDTMRLLARPLSARRLPKGFRKAFAANLLIPILQTIGRAIRGGSPADVYFVDAAWAPNSALGTSDTSETSVLVTMQQLLRGYLAPDCNPAYCPPVLRALYAPFGEAFKQIEGLQTRENAAALGPD
ncbi:ATP-binding protein [Hymenobacter sp. 5414T-23]|uniref:ATP-binding protein n=1 Tax=Hymenobacter sp. 5414T-23 TaxID=2932252 RepID=UPI001FD18685|nr:ATP-binding protein [Hymenobacter sp. 5414T-23]UOQ83244.1 ATP-binding protein [Hymenobacter sp. 5414T-23]